MQQKFEKEIILLKENVDELKHQIDERVRLISVVQTVEYCRGNEA